MVGSSAIIIGESGFARSVWGASAVVRTDAVIAEALSWGVAAFSIWRKYAPVGRFRGVIRGTLDVEELEGAVRGCGPPCARRR